MKRTCNKCGQSYDDIYGKECPYCGTPHLKGLQPTVYGPPPVIQPTVYGPPPIIRKPRPTKILLITIIVVVVGLILWLLRRTVMNPEPVVYGPPPIENTVGK